MSYTEKRKQRGKGITFADLAKEILPGLIEWTVQFTGIYTEGLSGIGHTRRAASRATSWRKGKPRLGPSPSVQRLSSRASVQWRQSAPITAVIGASATEAARPSTAHSIKAAMVGVRAVPITTTLPSCAALKAARSR